MKKRPIRLATNKALGALVRQLKQWQPWNKSTGARTQEGKAIASRNAFKGGLRFLLRDMSTLLREQKDAMKRFK